ncbi:MAG: gamma-glutamylcyclotransferase [Planctomycetaceae bacterium]|nr:gamma-glutamylcyclotransferase [Planctomycetaceae bacterium]
MKYFAYGSNCNPAVMERKGVRYRTRQPARLTGFRLLFNKRSLKPTVPAGVGFANIHLDSAGLVEGILYDLVPDDLPTLDASERYPDHYTRISVSVETSAGLVLCEAYQAQLDKVATGLRPSREYLNHLLAAKDLMSEGYYLALAQTEIFVNEM